MCKGPDRWLLRQEQGRHGHGGRGCVLLLAVAGCAGTPKAASTPAYAKRAQQAPGPKNHVLIYKELGVYWGRRLDTPRDDI